jgi:hypothetical protein
MAILERPSPLGPAPQFPRRQGIECGAFAGAAQASSDDGRVGDAFAGGDSGQGVDDEMLGNPRFAAEGGD